jgi:ribosomal-protein-alanine N-acetyltransferase
LGGRGRPSFAKGGGGGGFLDLEALLTLETACFPDNPWSRRQWEEELRHPHALLLPAWEDDELLGYAAFRTLADEAELLRIATAPEARRRGIAAALLARGLERLQEDGVRRCFLEVRADNLPAVALYRRFGFCESGRRRGYYPDGCDALLMSR